MTSTTTADEVLNAGLAASDNHQRGYRPAAQLADRADAHEPRQDWRCGESFEQIEIASLGHPVWRLHILR